MAVLTVATCQFPVSADIGANLHYVKRQMGLASRRGARVAHFPEGSLSGYAGTDFASFAGFGWDQLHDATADTAEHARELGMWVVLGSAHRISDGHKPHNSSYVISASGQIAERYDKRFCSGDSAGQTGDLAHYSPGRHFSVWSIDGVACGALICYDYRFPELYREYKKRGVQLVFHSFHAARFSSERIAAVGQVIGPGFARLNRSATHTYPGITMPAAMTAAAAANHVWISCPNSSAPQSCWPAFFVRADGVTTGRLRRNVPGVLISALDPERDLYDLDRGLAGPRPGRCPAQRHRRQRPALRRPHPDLKSLSEQVAQFGVGSRRLAPARWNIGPVITGPMFHRYECEAGRGLTWGDGGTDGIDGVRTAGLGLGGRGSGLGGRGLGWAAGGRGLLVRVGGGGDVVVHAEEVLGVVLGLEAG